MPKLSRRRLPRHWRPRRLPCAGLRPRSTRPSTPEETGGRFELQIFPASQLGSDTNTLGQIRSGAVDFFTLSGLILSTLVPVAALNGVGFAFREYDTVWKAMDGGVGALVRAEIAKSGSIFAFEKIWDNGFRQTTTSTRPTATPADFVNLKIRVPPAPLWISMFRAFGSSPTTINFNEVYTALQTKVVDAQENPLAIIETAKLYEVQSFCSLTNHVWDGFWFLVNKNNWEQLPSDVQGVVVKHINAAAVAERADAELTRSLQQQLAARRRAAQFYEEWRKKFGDAAWATLQASVGALG